MKSTCQGETRMTGGLPNTPNARAHEGRSKLLILLQLKNGRHRF